MTADNKVCGQPPGGLKALADRTRHDQAFHGDKSRDNARSAAGLPPVTAIARATLDAALPADVRARLENDEPVAIVESVPSPDWIDEIRIAVAEITETAHYQVHDCRFPPRFDPEFHYCADPPGRDAIPVFQQTEESVRISLWWKWRGIAAQSQVEIATAGQASNKHPLLDASASAQNRSSPACIGMQANRR